MNEFTVSLEDSVCATALGGAQGQNLRLLEKAFHVQVVLRGSDLVVQGTLEDIEKLRGLIRMLAPLWKKGSSISSEEMEYAIELSTQDHSYPDLLSTLFSKEHLFITAKGRPIAPKTLQQKKYIECIEKGKITFGIGPAGTGKTFLALTMAVKALRNKEVARIILTRPVVEAGEHLGFLPGDVQAKVNPYFRPLYDALYDLLDLEKAQKLVEKNIIEIAPLAYMRGRTLNDAFIILDEGQNTLYSQIKMFLTRLGQNSRMVITGDITQVDLPLGKESGLLPMRDVLGKIDGIGFIFFTEQDVLRSSLVRKMVGAFQSYEKRKKQKG